jgi:prevent-host-death family protein
MKTVTTAEAENSFDQFLDLAQREPLLVTRRNRPVGVFLSMRDFDDLISGERARCSHAEGYLGRDESGRILDELISQ